MLITAAFLHWGTEQFELKLQRQLTEDYSLHSLLICFAVSHTAQQLKGNSYIFPNYT